MEVTKKRCIWESNKHKLGIESVILVMQSKRMRKVKAMVLSVIFVGHGIGPTIHEAPMIPHYGEAGKGLRLKEGMVITIEPMINTGTWKMKMDPNGWTAYTLDGGLSCQYEHSLAITKDGPRILTSQGEEGTY